MKVVESKDEGKKNQVANINNKKKEISLTLIQREARTEFPVFLVIGSLQECPPTNLSLCFAENENTSSTSRRTLAKMRSGNLFMECQ